jgi:hypothetical protein
VEPDATGPRRSGRSRVFRYRSTAPDRLVENNLAPIANDFLNRLRASYASRKLTAVFGDPKPTRLAGRPAIVCRASTSAADGTVHSGEIAVTWSGDQIFVVSTNARTDQSETVVTGLATCLAITFAVDTAGERPGGGEGTTPKRSPDRGCLAHRGDDPQRGALRRAVRRRRRSGRASYWVHDALRTRATRIAVSSWNPPSRPTVRGPCRADSSAALRRKRSRCGSGSTTGSRARDA